MNKQEAEAKAKQILASAFVCSHCGVMAHHQWGTVFTHGGEILRQDEWLASKCANCDGATVAYKGARVYPVGLIGPPPAGDMSAPVREVYEEARAIASASPRAAAALLRVCIELVVNELEPGAGQLNAKIGKLVQRGLDPDIQRMLDSVRVYGNEGGAHPGEINLNEQPKTVSMLMFCVNNIVVRLITQPRQIEALYNTLPSDKRKGIENRDRKAAKPS